jgi:hypothetical protein
MMLKKDVLFLFHLLKQLILCTYFSCGLSYKSGFKAMDVTNVQGFDAPISTIENVRGKIFII